MEPVFLSLRWQNFLTIGVMIAGIGLVYVLVTQAARKVLPSTTAA